MDRELQARGLEEHGFGVSRALLVSRGDPGEGYCGVRERPGQLSLSECQDSAAGAPNVERRGILAAAVAACVAERIPPRA